MRVIRAATGRVGAWIVLAIGLVAVGAVFGLLPMEASGSIPTTGLPSSAESQRAAARLDAFPGTPATPGVLVWSRSDGGELSTSDYRAIVARGPELAELTPTPARPVQPALAENRRSASATVSVRSSAVEDDPQAIAADLRSAAAKGLPDGIRVRLGGPVGFASDTVGAFAGTDLRLLVITASVVAVLLILTYRSPLLWIVPLAVIGAADGLARTVVAVLGDAVGIDISAQVSGILSVLVFGAGTDYALLLVSRYRDELRRTPDRHAAMTAALRGALPAILGSAATVILALLVLLLADLEGTRALGFACAIGIALALLFVVVLLPPALVVFGRGLFWPVVPRVDAGGSADRGVWAGVARAVRAHPVPYAIGAVLLVGALSSGLIGARVGVSQTEQLRGDPESVQAQRILDRDVSPGFGNAAIMLVRDEYARDRSPGTPTAIALRHDRIRSATPTASNDGYTSVILDLRAQPQSDRALGLIRELRAELADQGGRVADTLVGGPDATTLDQRAAIARDEGVIIPIVAGIVLVLLVVILRSIVAPLILLASVGATLLASLGVGALVFQRLLGLPGLDPSVPLYAFIFLVALGVDYTIFLSSRAREEAAVLGVRDGMQRALAATGGVITSAGILLAAVFVVLSVLPVLALLQVGVIVCVGVLLDTVVVRTVLVPAIAFLVGRGFFWPARLPHPLRAPLGDA